MCQLTGKMCVCCYYALCPYIYRHVEELTSWTVESLYIYRNCPMLLSPLLCRSI